MSIQSEAERIKGEVAAQEALLAQISAVLDGKVGGGTAEPVEEKDVNFWDYDGTLLYSYTLEELQALTELPPLPERKGLTCQGWNWTLEQIKSFGLQVDVGAVYITDDGKTRIKIDISSMLIANVTLNFGGAVVNIDWGDGSEIEVSSGTGIKQHTHQYSATGIYTIALEVVSGTLILTGSNSKKPLIGGSETDSTRCAIEVNCGSNLNAVSFLYNSLLYSRRLRYITIPEGVTSIAAGALKYVDSLQALILPKTIITTATMETLNAIKVISFPWGQETIGATDGVASLTRLVIPPNIKSVGQFIAANCFNSNGQLAEIYCHSPTPPTLGDANMLNKSASYLKIYVPTGSLEAYQTATNWSTAADKMEEKDL